MEIKIIFSENSIYYKKGIKFQNYEGIINVSYNFDNSKRVEFNSNDTGYIFNISDIKEFYTIYKCEYCGKEKRNEFGICPHCARFPKNNYKNINNSSELTEEGIACLLNICKKLFSDSKYEEYLNQIENLKINLENN